MGREKAKRCHGGTSKWEKRMSGTVMRGRGWERVEGEGAKANTLKERQAYLIDLLK